MQRLHHHDLVGHLLDKGGWTHLCLPARYEADHPHIYTHDPRRKEGELLWPAHFPESAVREAELNLGSYGTAGQLQQRPAPRSGGMFDRTWWQYVESRASVPKGERLVRGWDLGAGKEEPANWTAGVLMKLINGSYYILDVVRFRGTPGAVERGIKSTADLDGTDILIDLPQDPGQAGKSQIRYLTKLLRGYNVRSSPESGSKEVRADPLSAQAEGGNVYLVRAPWNTVFIDEAALFPNSDFDDQVDAASRAFHRLTGKKRRVADSPPEVVVLEG